MKCDSDCKLKDFKWNGKCAVPLFFICVIARTANGSLYKLIHIISIIDFHGYRSRATAFTFWGDS